MSGRFVKVAGLGVAAGAGYYLYQAGGSPKVAEKQFERTFSIIRSPDPYIQNLTQHNRRCRQTLLKSEIRTARKGKGSQNPVEGQRRASWEEHR
jgi:hypothetical protein